MEYVTLLTGTAKDACIYVTLLTGTAKDASTDIIENRKAQATPATWHQLIAVVCAVYATDRCVHGRRNHRLHRVAITTR